MALDTHGLGIPFWILSSFLLTWQPEFRGARKGLGMQDPKVNSQVDIPLSTRIRAL